MTTKGAALLGLVIGFIGGSAATYFYLKYKNQEEVEVVPYEKVTVSRTDPEKNTFDKDRDKTENDFTEEKTEYKQIISKNSYSQYYNEKVELNKDEIENSSRSGPYITTISPGEYGNDPEYTKITLKYFADGVLLDDANEPVEDIEGTVGNRFYTHFGEYEPDTVYVRNDAMKCDFEILFVDENFMDS